MSRNIKEIGKKLLGKSLNSFHRKTGLPQLERNNEMQDGILDGILSQVDDAYIEKTEQSNVIHLDGSGDGVVVLDSIEGNTLVNLFDDSNVTTEVFTIQGCKFNLKTMISKYGKIYIPLEKLHLFKSNGKYKVIVNITKNTLAESEGTQRQRALEMLTYNYANNAIEHSTNGSYSTTYDYGEIGIKECIITMKNFDNPSNPFNRTMEFSSSFYADSGELEGYIIISEYNENILYHTQPFKGLQSSFEEKVNDEGKYEIEILMNNLNLLDSKKLVQGVADYGTIGKVPTYTPQQTLRCTTKVEDAIPVKPNTVVSCYSEKYNLAIGELKNGLTNGDSNWRAGRYTTTTKADTTHIVIQVCKKDNTDISPSEIKEGDIVVYLGDSSYSNIPHKQNKIKFLINEPLRKITSNIKDRLCIKDDKLVVERNCKKVKFDGTIGVHNHRYDENNQIQIIIVYSSPTISDKKNNSAYTVNSTLPCITQPSYGMRTVPNFSGYVDTSAKFVGAIPNKTGISFTDEDVKNYFKDNPMDVVYELEEPYYEEVLNEYGEPILLEGYENGTLYIDSTIMPTTTVKYTPKMETLNTLKEVNKNNNLITLDINENIIPYMMDVDYMIMEKELCLLNTKNIRKMEVLDMTSMQKRTQEMLERLIKGKTLTEQECKTRVTTYLNAGKITDEQAEELMLLINEVYA